MIKRVFAVPAIVLIGCGLAAAIPQIPYVNGASAVPPVDAHPLAIRHDAGGDGRFLSPRNGGRKHRGVDLLAPLHSPVHAIRSGRVITVARHPGMGRYVEIEHAPGFKSLYAHLREVRVAEGQRLAQGAVIGTVGKTGNARFSWISPHLHLEVWRDGAPVDPASVGLAMIEPAARIAQGQQAELDESGGE